MGLVRVSTNATVLSELTTDETDLEDSISGMFVNEGWTALWDGIRLGNDVLQTGAVLQAITTYVLIRHTEALWYLQMGKTTTLETRSKAQVLATASTPH